MKEKDRLSKLFEEARSARLLVDEDELNRLVSSGKKVSADKIKLGKAGRGLFNPLNIIVMISIIATVLAVFTIFSDGIIKSSVISHQSSVISLSKVISQKSSASSQFSEDELSAVDSPLSLVPGPRSLDETTVPAGDMPSVNEGDEPLVLSAAGPVLKDTLIIGEVIHLTQDELTKLGFLFNDDGFFYCNEDERGFLNFFSDRNPDSKVQAWASTHGFSSKPLNQRKEITHFPFYPGGLTGAHGERLLDYSRRVQSAARYGKAFYDDLSVPVYFPGRWFVDKKSSDKIIWFAVADEFFELLPFEKIEKAKERIDIVTKLRAIPGNETKNYVEFDFMSHNSTRIDPLELNIEALIKLGFTVDKDKIIYRYQNGENFLALTLHKMGSHFNARADAPDGELVKSRVFNSPMLGVTKRDGGYSVAVSTEFYPEVSDTIEFFSNMYEVSIPVIFTDESLPEIVHQSIFWFYPTKEFFNNLPDSIANPMRAEFTHNVIPILQGANMNSSSITIITGVLMEKLEEKTKSDETIPCQYFPSFCEGLPGLENLNVYPNPTSGFITVEMMLGRGKTIDFQIFDLAGRLMVDDVERKSYTEGGRYDQRMDLSTLDKGFYLLVLKDDEGARMTRRVVKN